MFGQTFNKVAQNTACPNGILAPAYDAATKANSSWRTPTSDEFKALAAGCVWIWTTDYNSTGKAGYIVYKAKNEEDKGKANMNGTWKKWDVSQSKYVTDGASEATGYTTSDTHIFFPAAGYGYGTSLINAGSNGFYFSSSLSADATDSVCRLSFSNSNGNLQSYPRYCGFSVRPVTSGAAPETITPEKQDDGTYQFKMPAANVTVTAEFEEVPVSTYAVINGTPESDSAKNHGYITVDETAVEGDTVTVEVHPADGYQLKKLTYKETKIVSEILPEDFPAAESDVSGAPGSAWASEDKRCYLSYDGKALIFLNDAGDPDKEFRVDTSAVVSEDEDGNYVYTDGNTVTITFSVSEETLNTILFADTDGETWNGTYQKAACVAAGTLITMWDGTQKPVEELEIGDVIRTFDHEAGEVSSAPVCFLWESKNVSNAFVLTFEDGTEVTVIEEHGFYDRENREYAFLNARNAKDYVGHHFYNADSGCSPALVGFTVLSGNVDAYAVITAGHFNHLSNGLLSMCDGTVKPFANLFAFDGEMCFDAEKKQADIETYGLTPLEKVLAYEGFDETDYEIYRLQYLDVAAGKGFITWDWVRELSDYCVANGFVNTDDGPEEAEAPKLLMRALAPKKLLGGAFVPNAEDGTEITADEQGKYCFKMPAYSVIVTAEFEEIQYAELIAAALAGTSDQSVPGVVDVAVDQLGIHTVKLLKTVDMGDKDVTVAENVFFDLNHFALTTTGKITNNGVIILHQENADIVEDLLYNVPGNYATDEELKLPNDASPDYVIPASTFMTSEVGTDPAYQELSFASGDDMLVWNKDVTAGVQIDVAYSLTLGGDILGAKGDNVKPAKATAINVALSDNIAIGGNNGEGEASLVIKSYPADDLFPETIGTFTANGKKITLNKSGKLVISANIIFDESVLVSGVNGMVVVKTENKTDDTVTYFLDTPHAHNPVLVNGQAATETAAGWKDYYKCDCGKLFEDAACKVEITDLDAWKAEGGNGYLPKIVDPKPGDASKMTLWMILALFASAGIYACLEFGGRRKAR